MVNSVFVNSAYGSRNLIYCADVLRHRERAEYPRRRAETSRNMVTWSLTGTISMVGVMVGVLVLVGDGLGEPVVAMMEAENVGVLVSMGDPVMEGMAVGV